MRFQDFLCGPVLNSYWQLIVVNKIALFIAIGCKRLGINVGNRI
jgi:hypothetical protein